MSYKILRFYGYWFMDFKTLTKIHCYWFENFNFYSNLLLFNFLIIIDFVIILNYFLLVSKFFIFLLTRLDFENIMFIHRNLRIHVIKIYPHAYISHFFLSLKRKYSYVAMYGLIYIYIYVLHEKYLEIF